MLTSLEREILKTIEIIKPDDWHVHFRDGEILKAVVPETSKHFTRAIVMPNLIPPVLTGLDALKYKLRIEEAIPQSDSFTPLMTLYLTEKTDLKDLEKVHHLQLKLHQRQQEKPLRSLEFKILR